MKKWIRPLILVVAFIATVIVSESVTNKVNTDLTSSMKDASLPVVYFDYDDITINELHGYTTAMDITSMHDTITPVKEDRLLHLDIATYGQVINEISYEIRTADDSRLVADGEITEYNQEGNTITFDEEVENLLEAGVEYSYCLKLNVNDRDVYYYTHLMQPDGSNIDESLAFAMQFHDYTLNGEGDSFIPTYMDAATGDATTLNYVDLSCTLKQITWADFQGQVLTDVVASVREINSSYDVVMLDYVMSSVNDSGETEYYNIEEYYRLRLTETRMYVLNFERTMNQIFRGENTILSDSKDLQLGIRDTDVEYCASDSGDIIAFVQEGELWCYDSTQNNIARVFSFRSLEGIDSRENWDQHGIKIVNVDEAGSVNFVVYGYMNRGDREGQVGVAVYHYDGLAHTVEEEVFIPTEKSYEVLKAELGKLLYVNDMGELFLTVAGNVYDVSMDSMSARVLVQNINSKSCAVSESGRYFAWVDADEINCATVIQVMDLKDKSTREITASSGQYIRPLGFIDEDFIYGTADISDIVTDAAGKVNFAMNSVKIMETSESDLTQVKDYRPVSGYITGISVEDYIITVNLENKVGDRFTSNGTDSIMNKDADTKENVLIVTTVTEVKETQVQLDIQNTPTGTAKMITSSMLLTENDSTLEIQDSFDKEMYYVYSRGKIVVATDDISEAVEEADAALGVVIDSSQNYVWMRAKRDYVDPLSGFSVNEGDTDSSSVVQCVSALLTREDLGLTVSSLFNNGNSVEEAMQSVLSEDRVLDISGCSLTETLYYVSRGKPVFAMTDSDHAVLLTGYTASLLYYYDPTVGGTQSMSLDTAADLFEDAGNVFIAYLEN